MRDAEGAKLPDEIRSEARLAAQHHCVALQRRDVRSDLCRGYSPAARRYPQHIINIRFRLQVVLADLRVIDRVLLIADDVVEPDPPEIMIT
jgi:hypothetical protein